jgi:hypothetical protein
MEGMNNEEREEGKGRILELSCHLILSNGYDIRLVSDEILKIGMI